MYRVFWLMLLLATACTRRETASGTWTGVAVPDAAATGGPGASDQSSPVSNPEGRGGPDAAPGKAAASDLAPPSFPTPDLPDAAPGGSSVASDTRAATPEDPGLLPRDASPDVTDAHPCPDAARCD